MNVLALRRAGARLCAAGLLALGGAACGGAASAPAPSPIATGTAEIVDVTPTEEPEPTVEVQTAPTPQPSASRCPDPYAGGVPYDATPGQPLRLRPTGVAPPLPRFPATTVRRDAALDRVVRDELGSQLRHFAVVIKDLDHGSGVSIDGNRGLYPASLFKVWVMLEAFHQREAGLFDFEERFVVSSYYERFRLNPGELEPCSEVTGREAVSAMMSVSDNVAANMMYERAGYANVNNTLRDIGLAYTGLTEDGGLLTTAGGTATLLEAIAEGRAVSEAASQEMLALLESEVITDRLPALLPAGTRVAHKTGNWSNATHDAGIVFSPAATYLIVVLTDYGYSDGGAARIARLSRAVYEYYNPS